jgi:hypothetical protein
MISMVFLLGGALGGCGLFFQNQRDRAKVRDFSRFETKATF